MHKLIEIWHHAFNRFCCRNAGLANMRSITVSRLIFIIGGVFLCLGIYTFILLGKKRNYDIEYQERIVIGSLLMYKEAQDRYYRLDHDKDGIFEYCLSISLLSKSNPSMEELAQAEIVRADKKSFLGFYFKVLTAQGENAPGGSRSFLVGEDLSGGYALLAIPEKDLISIFPAIAIHFSGKLWRKRIRDGDYKMILETTVFNPDSTWFPFKVGPGGWPSRER